ncbi:MAG: sulfur transferase domain-containing protein [Hyphomicrobiaceae bacterium]|jgi:sulfide:quinone oxidoreductase
MAMDKITYITPQFAVTSELAPEDFPAAAALGFKSIISNLPDGESADGLTARREAVLAWRHGLTFQHVPAPKLDIFSDAVVGAMEDALHRTPGPVLAHCKSGLRSAIAWAAASARSQQVTCVLDTLAAAGFDLDFIRDDLDAQAHRKHWLGLAPAMDCGCPEPAERTPAAAA